MSQIYILPYVRKGLSTNITSSGTSVKKRADVVVKLGVELNEKSTNRAKTQELDGQTIQLMGPADVKSISSRAINLISPRENSDVKLYKEYMPFIEFYEEDLPWRYTPVDDSDPYFHSWMALIAVKEDEVEFKIMPDGTKAVILKINTEERYKEIFPSNELLAKVAHVQIDSDISVSQLNANTILDANPECGISRILCTSTLEVNSSYITLLIPSYELGRLAALGLSTEEVPLGKCAWEQSLEGQSTRAEGLTFPYYKKWKFKTSSIPANFKELASRLFFTGDNEYKNLKAYLDVDISQSGLKDIHYDEEEVVDIPAALVLDNANPSIREESPEYRKALKALLALNPVLKENETGEINMEEDPWVVPPIYGARHLLTTQKKFNSPTSDVVQEVNLKLQNRVAAGLGSSVVKKNQEKFVDRAWRKVEKINQLNQAIREYYQMKQVDQKASNKHQTVEKTKVNKKEKALLMDVAQRNLNAAKIYSNKVSADTLLATLQKMSKVESHNQIVRSGITVDELIGIYDKNVWTSLLSKDELRRELSVQLPNKGFFYERFPQYYFLQDLGLDVSKNDKGLFSFTPAQTAIKIPSADALMYTGVGLCFRFSNFTSDNKISLLSNELRPLLDYVSGRKKIFDRITRVANGVQAIPVNLDVDGADGILVPNMEQFKLSNNKPLRVEYEVKGDKKLFYIIPWSYLRNKPNLTYELNVSNKAIFGFISGNFEVLNVQKDSNDFFTPILESIKNANWYKLTQSKSYKNLQRITNVFSKHSSIDIPFSKVIDLSTSGISMKILILRDLSCYIYMENYVFSFRTTDKLFNPHIKKVNDSINTIDCKPLAYTLQKNILDKLAFLEKILWEPTLIKLTNRDINVADFETLNAENIIDTIPFEPLTSNRVDSIIASIEQSQKSIANELKLELQPDEKKDEDSETIDPTKLGEERIEEIANKYGFTEDNQLDDLKKNLESKYPVMAYPDFLDPTYFYLREMSPDYIMPSAGSLSKNSITYFTTNSKFEESFLMGMNTEMGQELLWREYPTDQRGSYFRKFWDQEFLPDKKDLNKYYDIKKIHEWVSPLGKNHMPGKDGMLVFAISAELMAYYPNTSVFLSKLNGRSLDLYKAPDMTSWLNEETFLVGFQGLKSSQLDGYYLTFKQQPLSLQFERKNDSKASILGEFSVVQPHVYAIPLKNRKK